MKLEKKINLPEMKCAPIEEILLQCITQSFEAVKLEMRAVPSRKLIDAFLMLS